MRNKSNIFNSPGESSLSNRLSKIKYLCGLRLCIAGMNLAIRAAPGDLDTIFGTNGAVFSS